MAGDDRAVLGVSIDATPAEIAARYRLLARELHPDVNSDPGASQRFAAVAAAFENLRKSQVGNRGATAPPPRRPPPKRAAPPRLHPPRALRKRSRTEPASAHEIGVALTLAECAAGLSRNIEVSLARVCGRCDGSGCRADTGRTTCRACRGRGEIWDGTTRPNSIRYCRVCHGYGDVALVPCRRCRGDGMRQVSRKVTVAFPAGAQTGTTVRLAGQGDAGRDQGGPGDLVVKVTAKHHKVFRRDGADLYCTIGLSSRTAELGGVVELPTLEGVEDLRIDPGTALCSTIVLRGRGMPRLDGSGRGDLTVRFRSVPVPEAAQPPGLLGRMRESVASWWIPSFTETPARCIFAASGGCRGDSCARADAGDGPNPGKRCART